MNLHSTVVLLKVQMQRLLNLPLLDLHSTVVLLKDLRIVGLWVAYLYLHSTVVLLKADKEERAEELRKGFTFYCSSIKRKNHLIK